MVGTGQIQRLGIAPFPVADLRHVLAVAVDVLFVLDQLVLQLPLQMNALAARLRQAIDDVHDEMEAIQIVEYRHVEGGRDRAFFLVAADVKVGVIGAAIGQPVNQPRVGVEGEDDRFVRREQGVELRIAQAVRMFGLAAAAS